jgi:hypothetical protein
MRNFASLGKMLLSMLVLAVVFSVSANAQAPILEGFRVEATLPYDQIGTSQEINVPSNIVGSITGGALEIRQQMEYIPASKLLRVRHLLVAPSSPNPTPDGAQTGLVEEFFVRVTDVWASVASVPPGTNPSTGQPFVNNSLVLTGAVERYTTDSPFNVRSGNRVLVSLGYDNSATPARFTDLTYIVPGRITTYVETATGTLGFQGQTPGPGTGDGPKADAGPDLTTVSSDILLNGTASTGTGLTYSWRVLTGSASLTNNTSATPRAQLTESFGTYEFELTVTDSSGRSSSDTVKVMFAGTSRF